MNSTSSISAVIGFWISMDITARDTSSRLELDSASVERRTMTSRGSDVAGMQTSYVWDGDTAVINGGKHYTTCGAEAKAIIVMARDPQVENLHQAGTMFIVDVDTPAEFFAPIVRSQVIRRTPAGSCSSNATFV